MRRLEVINHTELEKSPFDVIFINCWNEFPSSFRYSFECLLTCSMVFGSRWDSQPVQSSPQTILLFFSIMMRKYSSFPFTVSNHYLWVKWEAKADNVERNPPSTLIWKRGICINTFGNENNNNKALSE